MSNQIQHHFTFFVDMDGTETDLVFLVTEILDRLQVSTPQGALDTQDNFIEIERNVLYDGSTRSDDFSDFRFIIHVLPKGSTLIENRIELARGLLSGLNESNLRVEFSAEFSI